MANLQNIQIFFIIFDGNGRNLTKRIEHTAGKGEIARYEQKSEYNSII